MSRLLLTGARVLAPDALSAPFADLLVEAGRIAAVLQPGTAVEDAPRHDASGRLVIPGLVNGHTHGHGGLAKGSGDKWDLALLLAHGPWISGGRGLQDKWLSTALTAVEMLKKGCTAAFDLPAELPAPTVEGLDPNGGAYACRRLPRRARRPWFADLTFFQATPRPGRGAARAPSAARAEAMRMGSGPRIRWPRWHGGAGLVACAAGTSAGCARPFRCTGRTEFLEGLAAACRRIRHAMQTMSPNRATWPRRRDPLRRCDAAGTHGPPRLVGRWFSVAHGVWLTGPTRAEAKGGAGLSHNPGANMRLASGIAPARKAIRAGVTVGIGTDGSSSSDNQNMFEAMRLAAFASRLWEEAEEAEWLGTAETVRLATQGSSRLLGLEGGTIEAGKPADLVLLDLQHVNWAPLNDVANQLVWTEDGSAVTDVMVAGAWKLRDRRVLGLDEAKLAEEANAAAERLRATNAEARIWCQAVAPHVACHCRALAKGWTRSRRLLRAE
jgi:guanine deaminase